MLGSSFEGECFARGGWAGKMNWTGFDQAQFIQFIRIIRMEHQRKKVGVLFTVGLFVILLAMLGVYGPLSYMYEETGTKAISGIPLVVIQLVFTLVGFGLLLTNSSEVKWSGMAIALFVVSFNFIFSPYIQKFWFEVFFGFRNEPDITADSSMVTTFWERSLATSRVTPSFQSVRLSNLVSTSFLVAMTACIGRVRIQGVALSLLLFNTMFYLNFYLNALLAYSVTNKNEHFVYLDDYGTILVYLFAGISGLVAGVLLKTPKDEIKDYRLVHSKSSFFFSAIGSLFIFASFLCSFTGIIDGLNSFRFNSGAIMMAFGIVAGVIGSFVGSILAGKGQLHPRIFSIGLISGGLMTGILAGEYNNIGIASFLGFVGGLIAGIFNAVVRPKINKSKMIDSQGLLGPIVVVCFFAAYVVAPSMLNQLFIRNETVWVISKGSPETDWRVARYHLIYPSLTIVLALFAGLFLGFTNKAGNNKRIDYRDLKFFAYGFGLYDPPKREENTFDYKRSATQSQLNRQTAM